MTDALAPVAPEPARTRHSRWLPFGDRSRPRRLAKVLAWLAAIVLVLAVLDVLGIDVLGWFSDVWDALVRDRARLPARGLDAASREDQA